MHKDRSTQSVTASRRAPRAFTLVEVLISAIILAIGLVGLAAVFPAVISQQQSANDLTTAVSVSGTADGILATRLPALRSRLSDPDVIDRLDTFWHRISAVEGSERGNFYLQTPWRPPSPDLRLRESAVFEVGVGSLGTHHEYTLQLPHRPIASDNNPGDLVVHVELVGGTTFTLVPDPSAPVSPKFIEGENPRNWLDPPTGPNSINYLSGRIQFYFNIQPGERVQRVFVEYRWLNDRIVSHSDRLYPSDLPRYGWELAFRRNADGQLQYTTFIYRFDGLNAPFVPEVPQPNEFRAGMLRLDSGSVSYNSTEGRYELQTRGNLAEQLETGSWLLPQRGTGVTRVRRLISGSSGQSPRFELDGPPMWVDPVTGVAEPMIGNVDFWYMPTTIKAFSDQGQEIGVWRLRPLFATTRQVQL